MKEAARIAIPAKVGTRRAAAWREAGPDPRREARAREALERMVFDETGYHTWERMGAVAALLRQERLGPGPG